MTLAPRTLADLKGPHLNVEMTLLKLDIVEELYIGLPDGDRQSRNQVYRL